MLFGNPELSLNEADIVQFGVSSGLGLFPMTFDWAQIAYIGSPLLTPVSRFSESLSFD